jgi:hypothetical protein
MPRIFSLGQLCQLVNDLLQTDLSREMSIPIQLTVPSAGKIFAVLLLDFGDFQLKNHHAYGRELGTQARRLLARKPRADNSPPQPNKGAFVEAALHVRNTFLGRSRGANWTIRQLNVPLLLVKTECDRSSRPVLPTSWTLRRLRRVARVEEILLLLRVKPLRSSLGDCFRSQQPCVARTRHVHEGFVVIL